jgi:hypothetical protein
MYYGAASTSATFSAAASFAHAAKVFSDIGQSAYAAQLQAAAINAWNWGAAHPSVIYSNAGFSSANPEVDAYTTSMYQLCAAVYLYAVTGNATWRTYVEANYQNSHPLQWTYWYAFEGPLQDALLYYTTLPGVSGSVASVIKASKQSSMGGSEYLPAWQNATDAYRAYVKTSDYVWGSNQTKGEAGMLFANQLNHNLDPANAGNYRAAAAGFVNYFHGVNPLTMPMLTNIYSLGATTSANEMYHTWFGAGTIWSDAITSPNGPAPGYLTGGANPSFAPDGSYSGPPLIPPQNQPTQKSYKDWNAGYPEDSWQVTEPGIYYQAAYVCLLSNFLHAPTYTDWQTGYALTGASVATTANPSGDGISNLMKYAFGLDPTISQVSSLPQPQVQNFTVAGVTSPYLTITFNRQLGTGNLTYTVESTGDLTQGWTTICTATGIPPSGTATGPGLVSELSHGDVHTLTVRDIVPATSVGRRFLRVRVVSP